MPLPSGPDQRSSDPNLEFALLDHLITNLGGSEAGENCHGILRLDPYGVGLFALASWRRGSHLMYKPVCKLTCSLKYRFQSPGTKCQCRRYCASIRRGKLRVTSKSLTRAAPT